MNHRSAGIALAAAFALIFSASAGGGKVAVRHLRVGIADFGATPTQLAFAADVRRLSHGTLMIDLAPGYAGDVADKDRRVVEAVRAGELEMAWLPTRVWELEGVSSFRALQAPFLITGYRVLGKVITGPVGRGMIGGTSRLGIRTLGLTAVDLRRPLGARKPFVSLSDFRGARISVAAGSPTSKAAIAALGATPADVGGGELLGTALRDGTIDGAETAWDFILANGYYAFAKYVTGNVVFFPRADAISIREITYRSLTRAERSTLAAAVSSATKRSLVGDDARDAAQVQLLCAAQLRIATASAGDLKAMVASEKPVYAALAQDPTIAKWIGQIRKLARGTAAGPPLRIPPGCAA